MILVSAGIESAPPPGCNVEECMKHSFLAWAALSYGFAAPAAAAGPGRFEATFHNAKSNLCMGVAQGNTRFGAYVKQGQCRDAAADQFWVVEPPGPRGYHV